MVTVLCLVVFSGAVSPTIILSTAKGKQEVCVTFEDDLSNNNAA